MTDGYDKTPSNPHQRDTIDAKTHATYMRKKSLASLDKAREEILNRVEQDASKK